MYIATIEFDCPVDLEESAAVEAVSEYLDSAVSNGQALEYSSQFSRTSGGILARVLVPEEGSLDPSFANLYVRRSLARLTALGISARGTMYEKELEGNPFCGCSDRTSFVLSACYTTLIPALRCGDCFAPVPLYRIPPTYHDGEEYFDLRMWQSDHVSCDRLQMHCEVLERAATRQLTSVDSPLSLRGLDICRRIEELTGLPTYYYLYRPWHPSKKREAERKCPSCGGEWILEELWHDFRFKCDTCHLVSNHAQNL